jgi:phosphate ABC transporter phosphate-binding protein
MPETIGSVVVAYNLPGVSGLKLDGEAVAKIFMGNITMWNDAGIAELNPTATLPAEPIQTVTRSDSSGTTFVFSGYLELVSSDFEELYGQSKTVAWPDSIAAVGNSGVASEILSEEYRVGYVELSYAIQNGLDHASILNGDGTEYVAATIDSTSAAAAGATLPAGDGDWSGVHILNQPGANAYPIATFTYILIYKDLDVYGGDLNGTAAKDLIDFLWWCIHDGQEYSEALYYAPLPQSVVDLNEATLEMITFQGEPIR